MTQIELKVLDPHQPEGMIVQVEEDIVNDLLSTGHYKRLGSKKIVEKEEPVIKIKPNKSWAEKKIKSWIKENKFPIKYDIINDTKDDVLLRLKDKGYI